MKKDYDILKGAGRLEHVSFSPIRVIMDKAREMSEKGFDVISFSAGEPNFDTPSPIREATIRALRRGLTHYSSNRGILSLRQEIARKARPETGNDYNPDTEILVTNSGAEAINHAILANVDAGDEVIVFTPAFINYESLVKMCGATLTDIPLMPEDGFQINIETVKANITDKTKMIVINNPCNPTGVVYSYDVLKELAELAKEHNFLIVSDEIYNCLTYDGTPFYSIASFPGMKERTIVINGFSKTYAMTGWRVGYLLADWRMMEHIVKVHQYSTTSGNTFIQTALAETMNAPETMDEIHAMADAFARRKELITGLLDEIPQLSYIPPQGAFYIMVNVSGTGMDGAAFAERLLKEKYVAVVPAVGLGKECRDWVRISFAASDENIREGMRRIKELIG